jgi:hypothetical protein
MASGGEFQILWVTIVRTILAALPVHTGRVH